MRFLILVLFSFFTLQSEAQVFKPVSWTFDIQPLTGNEYNLVYTAQIKKGWNVYSQFTGEGGPVPTEITYESMAGATLQGKSSEEGYKKEGFDKLFEVNVIKFLDTKPFIISQKIKVTDATKPITGYLTFMTCDNERCLPPADVEFSFTIPAKKSLSNDEGIAPQKSNIQTKKTEDKTSTTVSQIKKIKLKAPTSENTSKENIIEDVTSNENGILKPVEWLIEKVDNGNGEQEIIFTAVMKKGWNVYSQFTSDEGPVPTLITFEHKDGVELLGPASESGYKKEGPDKLFDGVNVIKFLDKEPFVMVQKIKVLDETKPLSGYMTFMTCNDKTCLPPTDVEFSFFGTGVINNASNSIGSAMVTNIDGKVDQSREAIVTTLKEPLSGCGKEEGKDTSSLWWLLLAGMLGGFAALLTPCVFPMIPITVSFFTKDTKRKGWVNAVIYGISIIIIYVLLGFIITVTLGPAALQALSTNWIANTLFFIIFIFFAFSFFGYYEITLPSSWSTKSDQMADKGGLLGIFFMAATLALVSFSCTGPIVGTALVSAAKGGMIGPLIVMFGFSFALALPFGLFAAFPAWLNSLPRSGGWMNSVKVVLGFLEVGFAFKFLSTADLTQHWGFLRYEVFMGILILVAFAIAIYLFGFIKFPHDSANAKIGGTRKVIAGLFAVIGIYLISGFTINKDTGIYNSLWLTSGFSPPVMYNYFLDKGDVDPTIQAKYPSYTMCANNIGCFKDYYEGMAYAKEVGKPAFIDFTGHGCQNCRRTEDNIWVNDKVRETLNNDLVLISLYTDDREKLDEAFISVADDEKKRTVGAQWADFQVVNFKQNSQPLYIMMTADEQVITHPRGYEDGVSKYQEYLDCGLEYFKSM